MKLFIFAVISVVALIVAIAVTVRETVSFIREIREM